MLTLNINNKFTNISLYKTLKQNYELLKEENVSKVIESLLVENLINNQKNELNNFIIKTNKIIRPFPSYAAIGELYPSEKLLYNSIFTFEYYDTPFINNNVLLNTKFLRLKEIYNRDKITPNIYFDNYFINDNYKLLSLPDFFTQKTLYLKLLFFNSKNGKIYDFFLNNGLTNNSFIEISVNTEMYEYEFSSNENTIILNAIINEQVSEKQELLTKQLQPVLKNNKLITLKGEII
jgi:hypothetical protein